VAHIFSERFGATSCLVLLCFSRALTLFASIAPSYFQTEYVSLAQSLFPATTYNEVILRQIREYDASVRSEKCCQLERPTDSWSLVRQDGQTFMLRAVKWAHDKEGDFRDGVIFRLVGRVSAVFARDERIVFALDLPATAKSVYCLAAAAVSAYFPHPTCIHYDDLISRIPLPLENQLHDDAAAFASAMSSADSAVHLPSLAPAVACSIDRDGKVRVFVSESLVWEVDALELCRLNVSLKDLPAHVSQNIRAAVAGAFLARAQLLGADARYQKYKSVVNALRPHEFDVIKHGVHVASASFVLLDSNVCLLRVIIAICCPPP
jgi:hypothetical protein